MAGPSAGVHQPDGVCDAQRDSPPKRYLAARHELPYARRFQNASRARPIHANRAQRRKSPVHHQVI